ncbi:MAG TPA: ABC transporter ATP-binding protein, partial [Pseudonocardiaceae bacterium]
FMQELASQGRTVLVSSHLLSEMALTAQDLVVIGRGRLISQCTTAEFIEQAGAAGIRVRSPQLDQLSTLLTQSGAVVRPATADVGQSAAPAALMVSGMNGAAIGELAAANNVVLHELSPQSGSLEEAFMQLTGDSVDYRSPSAPAEAEAAIGK